MNETPTEDGAPVSQDVDPPAKPTLRHALGSRDPRMVKAAIRPSHMLRFFIALVLLIVSYYTNRGFLGWGLLFILGVLVVPVGRTRAFLLGFIPYAGVWFIFTALRSLADERNNVLRAKIVSAGSLSETYFNQLKHRLESSFGKRVIVEHEEDPSLLGGILVRVGDNTFDGSLRGRLEELERRLLATA